MAERSVETENSQLSRKTVGCSLYSISDSTTRILDTLKKITNGLADYVIT